MNFSIFINFKGECREALSFYEKVFQAKAGRIMSFSDMPPDPNYTVAEEDKNLVMYADLSIFGCNVMFSDIPSSMTLVKGNNISLTLSTKDEGEVRRVFNELKEGGSVDMELQTTFWSKLYGSVMDKYGIIWQVMVEGEEMI